MDEFVTYTSRWRTCILFVGSIAFVAAGVWMTGMLGDPPASRKASPETVMFWGWIATIFFGLSAVVSARLWWRNAELIRIGRDGIRSARWSDKTIPWAEIGDVTEWSYKGSRSIILHLREPSLFPGKGLVGLFGRANRTLTGGDVGITMAGTDRSFGEAMAAIEQFRSVD